MKGEKTMSTTADGQQPIPVRVPTRIPDHEHWRDDPGADRRIRELTGYRLARLEAEVLAPARGSAPADLRLRRMIAAYVALAITDPGIMALLSGEQQDRGGAANPSAVSDRIDRFISSLREALTEVIGTQDRLPSIDPRVAVHSLLGIIHWGVSSHRVEGRLSPEEASAQITFLALHGLVSQPHTPDRPAYPRRWNAA